MDPIQNVELAAIVTEADASIIDERKRKALAAVRTLLIEEHKLVSDIENTEKTLEKQKGQLAQKRSIIEKVKAGDWSALKEQNQGGKEQPKKEEGAEQA